MLESQLDNLVKALKRKGMTVIVKYTVYDGEQPQWVCADIRDAVKEALDVPQGRILREVTAESAALKLVSRVWVDITHDRIIQSLELSEFRDRTE
jgi:hypothetical protein